MKLGVFVAALTSAGCTLTVATGPSPALAAGAVYSVTTTADSGAGSFRQAIIKANDDRSAKPVTIEFNLASGCEADSVCSIAPTTALPAVTRADVTIDGFGQTGAGAVAHANTHPTLAAGDNALILIQLDGVNVDGAAAAILRIDGAGDAVEGVAVVDSSTDNQRLETGILIEKSAMGAKIQGDSLGAAVDGGFGALQNGVEVMEAAGVMIGGTTPAAVNVLSADTDGVLACSADNLTIARDLIGPNPTGTTAVSNVYASGSSDAVGAAIDDSSPDGDSCPSGSASSSGVSIGGIGDPTSASGRGNVISGNETGILLDGASAVAQNNFVGTTANGRSFLPNGTGVTDQGHRDRLESNVIAANSTVGVRVSGTGGSLEDNLIGYGVRGAVLDFPQSEGITIGCSDGSCPPATGIDIGVPGHGNRIGENAGAGIDIAGCHRCVLAANQIRSNQGAGISAEQADGVTIGGTAAGDANLITGNQGGVVVDGNGAQTHVAIRRNIIWDNPVVGSLTLGPGDITVGTQGVTCVSPPSATKANDNLACPVISAESPKSVAPDAPVQSVSGSAPAGSTVDLYVSNNDPAEAEQGGAILYLGSATASHASCGPSKCAGGDKGFTVRAPFAGGYTLDRGQPVTATATRAVPKSKPVEYDTSQFAHNFADLSGGDTTVTTTRDRYTAALPCDNASGAFTGTAHMTLRCAITEANLFPNSTVRFSISSGDPGCGSQSIHGKHARVCTLRPAAELPLLTANGLSIDGFAGAPGGARPNNNAFGKPDNSIHTITLKGQGISIAGVKEQVRGMTIVGVYPTPTIAAAVSFFGLPTKGTRIDGDFLGLEPNGETAARNVASIGAVAVFGSIGGTKGARIGGTAPADRNVMIDPLILDGDNGDLLQGNYIGVNANGNRGFDYPGACVQLGGDREVLGTNNPGGGNVISGCQAAGVTIGVATIGGGQDDIIRADRIGTNAAGTAAIPNGVGVEISGTSGTYFASGVVGPKNLISGNAGPGVLVQGGPLPPGSAFPAVTVTGNAIGTTTTSSPLPNRGPGIEVAGGVNPDQSPAPARMVLVSKNTVKDNGGPGIQIGATPKDGSQTVLSENLVHSNGGVGIALTGESSCSSRLTRGRPDDYTPCPTGLRLRGNAGKTTLAGTTCPGCLVEAFVVGHGPHDGSHGGSLNFLGSVTAGTCSSPPCAGNSAAFTLKGLTVPAGALVTATATQQKTGPKPVPLETSEFSADVRLRG